MNVAADSDVDEREGFVPLGRPDEGRFPEVGRADHRTPVEHRHATDDITHPEIPGE